MNFYENRKLLMYFNITEGIFRTLSNIRDGVIFAKIVIKG